MDEELARLVGQRIRRLRQQEGISLRRQAGLAGVSASALSALENGRGGMSLKALQKVAEQFGLSITELLVPAPNANGPSEDPPLPVEIFESCASADGVVKRGSGTLYHLLGRARGHSLQPYIVSFLPGAGYASDPIGHAGEEFAFVVIGEVDFMLGGEVHRLRQGDGIRFRAEPKHSFKNASSSGIAVIVGAATPPW